MQPRGHQQTWPNLAHQHPGIARPARDGGGGEQGRGRRWLWRSGKRQSGRQGQAAERGEIKQLMRGGDARRRGNDHDRLGSVLDGRKRGRRQGFAHASCQRERRFRRRRERTRRGEVGGFGPRAWRRGAGRFAAVVRRQLGCRSRLGRKGRGQRKRRLPHRGAHPDPSRQHEAQHGQRLAPAASRGHAGTFAVVAISVLAWTRCGVFSQRTAPPSRLRR